ncbi:hypothetical protein Q9233_010560 [Columba guinea]|nr:hypothetical protein Q9233_010560 [Columba guinea]
MAPLLGRKPFPLAKPLPPGEPGERFVIPHTQEAFRTRELLRCGLVWIYTVPASLIVVPVCVLSVESVK